VGALHLAYVHETPVRKKRRKGGGGDDGDGPFLIVPRDACEACTKHWHHKCWGANILDEYRPDCPCPCGDPTDSTGERMSQAAWSDLAQHDPLEAGKAVQRLRLREAGTWFACAWAKDESGLRASR
jgi:hypothetical protein